MTHILDDAAALFDNGNYSGQTIKKILRELKEKKPEQSADDVLDELRVIKPYDTIIYRTFERGVARVKVRGISEDGKWIGIEYRNSSFGGGCSIEMGIKVSEVLGVCREIPCTKEHPAQLRQQQGGRE